MLDQDDLKWIATTSTELNAMLQQISRYSDLARQHKGEYNYIEMLGERVELASRTAQAMFDRVTSLILEGSAKKVASRRRGEPPAFTIVPPPAAAPPAPQNQAPAQAVPAHQAPGIPTDIKVHNPGGNRELILLVDDDVDILEITSATLTDEGYKVILAREGFEALKIYEQLGQQIRLVILDFFLPVMDGDAVFDELRALNAEIDVVLSSGFAEQSKIRSMLGQGLRGFIPKPYTRAKLLEQVRSTLDAPRHGSLAS